MKSYNRLELYASLNACTLRTLHNTHAAYTYTTCGKHSSYKFVWCNNGRCKRDLIRYYFENCLNLNQTTAGVYRVLFPFFIKSVNVVIC